MVSNIGLPGLIIILAIVILLFGAKKIPEIAESVSQGIKKFKEAQDDEAPKKIEKNEDSDKKDA